MDINTYIETIIDEKNWKEVLLAQSKERLVDFIIDKMIHDDGYCREVYYKLDDRKEIIEVVIKKYIKAVKTEMDNRNPDVNLLLGLGERLIKRAKDSTISLLDCLKLYVVVIEYMDEAINQGAGFYDENEWELINLMDLSGESMVKSISELYIKSTVKELETVRCLLREKANEYNTIDGKNRIKEAYEAFITRGE